MMSSSGERRGGRGGRRAGAGRPQQRITLDLETANILRELVRQWREESPGGEYNAHRVAVDLIWREAIRRGLLESGSERQQRWLVVARGETPE